MFKPHVYIHSESEPWEYFQATAATSLNIGTALKLGTTGKLEKCAATDAPQFISMWKGLAGTNTVIPVERVRPETVYETELSVASSGITKGKAYTLASDAERITATDASGVATVVDWDGKETGDKVRVRFLGAAKA